MWFIFSLQSINESFLSLLIIRQGWRDRFAASLHLCGSHSRHHRPNEELCTRFPPKDRLFNWHKGTNCRSDEGIPSILQQSTDTLCFFLPQSNNIHSCVHLLNKANENENDEDDYLVDHSIVLYLLSPEGDFLEFFTQRMQVTDIVDKILEHVQRRKKEKHEKSW